MKRSHLEKVLQDGIEDPFMAEWFHKKLLTPEEV